MLSIVPCLAWLKFRVKGRQVRLAEADVNGLTCHLKEVGVSPIDNVELLGRNLDIPSIWTKTISKYTLTRIT